MKLTKTSWWILGGVGIAGLGVGAYLLFFQSKPKEKAYDFGTSAGKPKQVTSGGTATTITEPNWKKPFDMNYLKDVKKWLRGKQIKELSRDQAIQFAKQLKNAKGRFNDDEAAVKEVFAKRLRDKTQIASLSRAFWGLYKKDMWQHLRSFLSDAEMKDIVQDPIKKLPNYRLR